MDIGGFGWCDVGWDGLRFLDGTGDEGVCVVMEVFEGDGCVVGGQVSDMERLSNVENLFLVRRGDELGLGVSEDL